MLVVTGDVAGTASAGTIGVQGFMHRLQNLRVTAHAQVVVRTPDRDPLVPGCHVGLRKLLSEAIDIVEVAIGLVFVLLVQLGIVEAFIVKCGQFRGRRLWA